MTTLPVWLPVKLCPTCGANVYACVPVNPAVDLQQPGRTPICWSCSEILVIGADGRLRTPTAAELLALLDTEDLRELEGVRDALQDLRESPRLSAVGRQVLEEFHPWL